MRSLLVLTLVVCCVAQAEVVCEVASANVTAADLAGIVSAFSTLDPSTQFARSPAPGVVRRVNRYELYRWAEGAGSEVSPAELPDAVLIQRKMRPLSEDEVVKAIRREVARSQGFRFEDIDLEIHDFGARSAPAGIGELEISSLPRVLNEPASVGLRWQVPGGRSGVEAFRATLRVRGTWLVARGDVAAGSRLGEADVAEMTGFYPAPPSDLVSPERIVEQPEARRGITAGEPLRAADVRFTPLVERGALLELSLDLGAVRLRTSARAEESGGRGDLIACRNLETGRRVLGRIVDARSAELEVGHVR